MRAGAFLLPPPRPLARWRRAHRPLAPGPCFRHLSQALWRGFITRKKASAAKKLALKKLAAAEEEARRAPHKSLGARVRAALQEMTVAKEPAKVRLLLLLLGLGWGRLLGWNGCCGAGPGSGRRRRNPSHPRTPHRRWPRRRAAWSWARATAAAAAS